jgi:hypothetical protein
MPKSVAVSKDRAMLGMQADGEPVYVDLHALLSCLIQASSGSGKSWLIRRLIEQLYGRIQIIVVDPEGEFATLREKFDFVLAARDGDLPCDNRTAKALILKLLEHGASAILDVSELSQATGGKQEYVRIVAETLINAPRELRHPVLFRALVQPPQGESRRWRICAWNRQYQLHRERVGAVEARYLRYMASRKSQAPWPLCG